MSKITGKYLNDLHRLNAADAKYRRNGVWYHPLRSFPGVLFDDGGYVLFETSADYETCDSIKKGPDPNHIHVVGGIASLPSYVPFHGKMKS